MTLDLLAYIGRACLASSTDRWIVLAVVSAGLYVLLLGRLVTPSTHRWNDDSF